MSEPETLCEKERNCEWKSALSLFSLTASSKNEVDHPVQGKLKTLQSTLADTRRENQFLQSTVDRLQREKQQLIVDATKRGEKPQMKGKDKFWHL